MPLDNDIGFLLLNDMPKRCAVWKTAGPDRRVTAVRAERVAAQAVRVSAESVLPAASSPYSTTYTVYGSGDVVVEARFTPGGALPELPRFGMQMAVPAALGTMTWLGRGPPESYWDRHSGAPVGRYSGRVDELIHDYVRPQENGNRTDVRWITLTDADGAGRRDTITLKLDYRQTGVGGGDGWGARPHAEYTLDAKPYAYRFRLRAYTPAMGPLDDIARRPLPKP